MKNLVRRIIERLGYRYFKIAYQPLGLDHAHDVARFLGSATDLKVVFDVGANEGQTAEILCARISMCTDLLFRASCCYVQVSG